jgi:hypothetical protein
VSDPYWHTEATRRAANALCAVLMECCTVEECENTLAEINPDDWKRAAEQAVSEYNRASLEIARRDVQHAFARARARAAR